MFRLISPLTPVVVLTLLLSAAAEAGISSLTVAPEAPRCDETVTLRVEGWTPDGCHELTGIAEAWFDGNPGFQIDVDYDGGVACGQVITPYSAETIVGPLEIGDYTAFARELTTGDTWEQEIVYNPFTVSCPPVPGPVEELRVEKLGSLLRFTWAGAVCGQQYQLYGDSSPSGSFALPLGSSPNASGEIVIPLASRQRYFLVGASNPCGDGPKH
jgi:hypothetical protein